MGAVKGTKRCIGSPQDLKKNKEKKNDEKK